MGRWRWILAAALAGGVIGASATEVPTNGNGVLELQPRPCVCSDALTLGETGSRVYQCQCGTLTCALSEISLVRGTSSSLSCVK